MKNRFVSVARKAAVSLSVSAAVLSIANIDAMIGERRHALLEAQKQVQGQEQLQVQLAPLRALKPQLITTNERFRDSLTQDELGEENPFAMLSGMEALTKLMSKGVRHFERQTYRTPRYKGESGYDLVHYTIEQFDGTHSSVLAYLEGHTPMVVISVGEGLKSELHVFRGGDLMERSVVAGTQAHAAIDRRINESVPFLSVSR